MDFREVTAILRSDVLEQVENALKAVNVPGVSVTKVKGYGEYMDFYTPVWMCSHVRVEIFIGAHRTEAVAEAMMQAAHTGFEGDGIVAVLPVEAVCHIRTKEKCTYDACDWSLHMM